MDIWIIWGHKFRKKEIKTVKIMKDTLNQIRTDIEIIKESISNGDTKDAKRNTIRIRNFNFTRELKGKQPPTTNFISL